MKKLIKHLKIWNRWRKYSGDSFGQKLLVLLGNETPTFWMAKMNYGFDVAFKQSYKETRRDIKKILKNGGMTAKEGAELGKMLHDGIMQGFEEVNADE